jgi:DNA-directed RNA polymerase III subunit RPC2
MYPPPYKPRPSPRCPGPRPRPRQLAYLLGVQPASALLGSEVHTPGAALVFLNGGILGVHRRPHKFVRMMR